MPDYKQLSVEQARAKVDFRHSLSGPDLRDHDAQRRHLRLRAGNDSRSARASLTLLREAKTRDTVHGHARCD